MARRRRKNTEEPQEIQASVEETAKEQKTEKKKRPFWKRREKAKKEFNIYEEDVNYIEDSVDNTLYQEDMEQFRNWEEIQEVEDTVEKDEETQEKEEAEETNLFDASETGDENEKESKKRPKKKMLLIAGAAVIIIGAVSYFMVKNISGGDEGKAYVESVRVVAGLGSGNGISNRYTGIVEPQDSWKITLESDLSVEKCYVSVGDEVKKGDKLFSYNTEELKLSKEKKQLEVETFKNENTQLSKDIKSYQSDLKSASTSEKIELQTQILTAQTTIKKNEYSIKSGNEEIKTLEKNIKDATVKSKMDGVVKSINTSVGAGSGADAVDDGTMDTSGDTSTYMTILAVGDYRVKGTISETNIWSINEGDPVIVRSRVDDKTWHGSISKVKTDSTSDESENSDTSTMDYESDSSSGSENASTYNFYVALNDDADLMMGQHVFVEIDYGQDEQEDGLWLPSAYIRIDEDNYYVWAANKRDRLELKKIKVGDYNEELDEYQVLSGLAESDYIACDADNLKENMKTTKVESEADSTGEYYDEEPSDDALYDESFEGEDFSDDSALDESSYDDMSGEEAGFE